MKQQEKLGRIPLTVILYLSSSRDCSVQTSVKLHKSGSPFAESLAKNGEILDVIRFACQWADQLKLINYL